MFCEKDVPKNFLKIYRETPVLESLFNKVAGSRLWHKYFPVNFEKFFKNTFFYRTHPVAASGIGNYPALPSNYQFALN